MKPTTPAKTPLRRVAIANRGEAAMRFIRAARDLSAERGVPLETVALVTAPDAGAPFAREADFSVTLAVPAGLTAAAAYLDPTALVDAAVAAGADAIWPGWGFLSEDARLPIATEAAGLRFIGPPAKAMRIAGDKIEAKRLAERCGIPVVPWSGAALDSLVEVERFTATIGYPVILKAAAGGGGRGIRVVREPAALAAAFASATGEALRAFGDGRVFVERCIDRARHVEVQLVVDDRGHGVAYGVRDCTLQRRHQKVMEECPGPWVTPARVEQLEAWALAFAREAGYRNAGTVEFIVDLDRDDAVCFMEMNARLQVEHPATELVYGVDLVRLQLDVAMGLPLMPAPTPRGAAIELRLNAEDPDSGFAPSPGRVTRFVSPLGPGIRVDSGVTEGGAIPPDFDSNIAKILALGATRSEALARLRRALSETVVMIDGGTTNKGLLSDLLVDPDVASGDIDTRWLDRRLGSRDDTPRSGALPPNAPVPRPWATEALAIAAVLGFREDGRRDLANFYAAVARGVPQRLPDASEREIRLRSPFGRVSLHVLCIGYGRYVVSGGSPTADPTTADPTTADPTNADRTTVDPTSVDPARAGTRTTVAMGVIAGPNDRPDAHAVRPGHVLVGDRRFRLTAQGDERAFVVELDGVTHRITRDQGGVVRAPAPAVVMDIAVAVGDEVRAGQRLGVLEAMKMEMPLVAAEAGIVREVKVNAGAQVAAGQALVLMDPVGAGEAPSAVSPSLPPSPDPFMALVDKDGHLLNVARTPAAGREVADAVVAEARAILLGYGLVPERASRLTRLFDREATFESEAHPEHWLGLVAVLRAFADIESVFTRDLDGDAESGATGERMSNEARFWEFARHLGSATTVAPSYAPVLDAALAHYDATAASSPSVLRHVVARLAVATARHGARAELRHRIASGVLRAVMALHRGGLELDGDDALRMVLEQLPVVADPAWPFVADNAMQARYVLYQEPRFEERERDSTTRVEALLQAVAHGPMADRQTRLAELVHTSHSVSRQLVRATRVSEPPESRLAAADVLFRRLYESLGDASARLERGVPVVTLGALDRRVLGLVLTASQIDIGLELLQARLAEGSATVDLLIHPEGVPEAVIAGKVHALTRALPGAVRVTMVLGEDVPPKGATPGSRAVGAVIPQWSFAPGGPGAQELSHLRNLHPELAERLELWRYAEFHLTRVESHDRLVVFHARAKSNPKDERLFVVGEVRDVPEGEVLDEAPSALLAFEHAFHEAMRALREVQARRDVRARYLWNRVTLHVRPVVNVSRAQVRRVAARLAPYAEGLGLEAVVVRAHLSDRADVTPSDVQIRFASPSGHGAVFSVAPASTETIHAASPYELKLRAAKAYGVTYPYEVIRLLTEPEHGPRGAFVEYDLPPLAGPACAVSRAFGRNVAGVVFGLLKTPTAKVPEGLERVLLLSDPLHRMGALSEPECARIIAAIDLAEARGLCIEWLATSAGALIAMDSGTENLDWTARVLRRIIEFTRGGGAIHVVVDGVNVGAQSYFNAEATMLMHTRGVLIMTPKGSMVLTGKKALDASGGVSAEDERGIGGYERIMGVNGQAQMLARDLKHAFELLAHHHDV
ncbi:MAG: ATP-grasp domain-containing protein, partial [Myxococcales bacterium]|nr:ATP-grasp domain-containing protein [Myxococcales bacterium]